jgi:hypothetical protein
LVLVLVHCLFFLGSKNPLTAAMTHALTSEELTEFREIFNLVDRVRALQRCFDAYVVP